MNALANLSISKKITCGFVVVLILLVISAVYSIINFNSASENFTAYRALAIETNQSGRVQANVLMTRLLAKDFLINPSDDTIEQVKERQQASLALANELQKLSGSAANKRTADEIEKQLVIYGDTFKKVTEFQAVRDDIVKNVLNIKGKRIEKNLTSIMESAYKDNDADAAVYAGRTMRNLLLARLYVFRFLTDNDQESENRVNLEFAEMEKNAVVLLNSLQNPLRRELAEEVNTMVATYIDGFKQVVSSIYSRNELVKGTLDKIGPKIANDIEQQKLNVKKQQDTLGPRAQAEIQSAETNMGILSAIAIILGAVLAVTLGKVISKPIIAMTTSMKSLADGDMNVEITGQDKTDEVGLMAQAVQVFKDNMIETENLRKQREKDAAEQERLDKERAERELIEKERAREEAERLSKEQRTKELAALIADFEDDINEVTQNLNHSVEELRVTSDAMAAIAEEANSGTQIASKASTDTTENVQAVASASEEMNKSINEISARISDTAEMMSKASDDTNITVKTVVELSETTKRITEVVKLINDISEQTNLLALNATIEAARAGEAGKGFAVVASEVKALADQTGKATDEISDRINGITKQSEETVSAVTSIGEKIAETNELASSIAVEVEQQSLATGEISRNAQMAATGTVQVNESITKVNGSVSDTKSSSTSVSQASENLAIQGNNLTKVIQSFVERLQSI